MMTLKIETSFKLTLWCCVGRLIIFHMSLIVIFGNANKYM